MNFLPRGLKELAADAATALNRAVQFTEQRLGHGERTELDAYLENLLARAELARACTERLLAAAEAALQSSGPGARVEDFLIGKLGVQPPGAGANGQRPRALEALGSCMAAAGRELAPATGHSAYTRALVRCGQTQLRLGQREREFAARAERDFVRPLRRFLDEETKLLARERRALETRRLDLDAARSKYRKVRVASAGDAQQAAAARRAATDAAVTSARQCSQEPALVVRELDEVEAELHAARQEFDRQVELVTGLCNKIIQSGTQHAKCLSKFVEAQAEFLQHCDRELGDLLADRPPGGAASACNNSTDFASLAALSGDETLDGGVAK